VRRRSKPNWRRRVFILTPLLVLATYVFVVYSKVARQASSDETRHVDVIVVLGAAEYAGKPSPIYKSRLDHAAYLYKKGIAPLVITTGGHGDDPKFTEGQVGRDYLIAAGVPEAKAIAETQSENTADAAKRVAAIMRTNKLNTCLAVSDGYHLYRIKRMLETHGVTAYGAPRPAKPLSDQQRASLYLREVLSVSLWRLGIT
jgi:uncharacterized SAM-binding protein YcdF (DUF218 family)